MKNKHSFRSFSAVATLLLALAPSMRAATFTATFNNGFGDGIWERDQHIGNLGNPADPSTPGNWSTGAYPSNGHAISDPNTSTLVPGPNPFYDVVINIPAPCTLAIGVVVQTVNVASASTLNIAPNGLLAINAIDGLTNNGTITVNNGVNTTAKLRFDAAAQIAGAGVIRLKGIGSAFNVADFDLNGHDVALGAGQTLRGLGTLLSNGGLFTNNGTIIADNAAGGSMQLDFVYNDGLLHKNNSLIEAIGGGVVGLYSGTLDQTSGGSFLADGTGSMVQVGGTNLGGIIGATLIGGSLNTANGGITQIVGGNAALFKGVTNNGAVQVPASEVLFVRGTGLTNNGTILVNSTDPVNGTAALEFDETGALDGSGTVTLAGVGYNRANLKYGSGVTLTIGASQTIRGYGTILGDGLFVNNGTILGDNAAGNSLQLDFTYNDGLLHKNNGLIKAIGGGLVGLYSGTMDQTGGGVFSADGAGSMLQIGGTNLGGIIGATLIGGSLNTTNGGITQIVGGNAALFKGVTNNGAVQVPASEVLFVRGTGLTNNGTILVNSTDPVNGTAALEFDETGALDGSGTVTLAGVGYNRANLKYGSGVTLTIGASQTIRGYGTILGDGLFVNNGTILGDNAAGNSLQLDFTYNDGLLHKNNGLIKAIGGGLVGLYSGTMDQTGGGVFSADGAGSMLQIGGTNPGGIIGATLIGGILNTTNGAVIQIVGGNNALFKGVTNNGAIQIPASHTLFVRGTGLTNNGTILVNSTDPVSGTSVLEFDEAGTLGGTGRLTLDGASSGRAALFINNVAVTHGSGHTIGGNGDLFIDGAGASLLNNGKIAPGSSAGKLNFRGDLRLGSTSNLFFEIGGTTAATQYDVINKTDGGVLTLNGNLTLTLINGFTPTSGAIFTIVTTQNILAGAFTNVANGARLNTTDGGGSFKVTYSVVNDALLSRNVTLSDFQPAVVADTTPPVITVPADITVRKARHRKCTTVVFSVSALDAVDGPVAAIANPPSGSCFTKGTHTIVVTATDRSGNTATKTFNVTITKHKG